MTAIFSHIPSYYRCLLLLAVVCFAMGCPPPSNNPPQGDDNFTWARRMGSPLADSAMDVSMDPDGNATVVGVYQSFAQFAGSSNTSRTLSAKGGDDIFVARYNPDGALTWLKSAGGTSQETPYAVASLANGGAVVTGCFEGSAVFGDFEVNRTVLSSSGGQDGFIAFYNADGSLLWARQFGGEGNECGLGIAVHTDGTIYITGYYEDGALFGARGANRATLGSAGGTDIFVARYFSFAELSWVKPAGGEKDDMGNDVKVLADASCVVTGSYQDAAIFGDNESRRTLLQAVQTKQDEETPNEDAFLARFNSFGFLEWAVGSGGAGADRGNAVAVVDKDNFLMTGVFQGTGRFGANTVYTQFVNSAGGDDAYVARFDSLGHLQWVRRAGGSGEDGAKDIARLDNGEFMLTGIFSGSAVFDPEFNKVVRPISRGVTDIFVARYTSTGHLHWLQTAGGTGADTAWAIASDPATASTRLAGQFELSAQFGRNGMNEANLVSQGLTDAFVARYDEVPEDTAN